MEVHGITPADVASEPTFPQVAEKIYDFFGDSDIAGYNSNRFDIPMLQEEMYRAGFEFDIENRRIIDVQRIFYSMEPRTLEAALRFYCDKELKDAHDAMADVRATADVLKGQIEKYDGVDGKDRKGNEVENPVRNEMQALHDFTFDDDIIDGTRRLKYDTDRNVVFNFGKHRGKKVGEVCYSDRSYYNWILNKDFAYQVKKVVKNELDKFKKRHGAG
jgi:DNA polymerase-3 subunit epsilon